MCGRSPTTQLDAIGPQMAGFAAVSHCYRRPTYDDWPYSVFTMVHGRSARDCEATIDAIRTETGVDEYCLLVVGEGVQEGARPLLHVRMGRVAHIPHRVTPPKGGGGGGSSYVGPSATNTVLESGTRRGDGFLTITWTT